MKPDKWHASPDPSRMLGFAWRETGDERRLRLAAAAAWERYAADHLDPDPALGDLLDLAARVADGEATEAERAAGFARSPAGRPGGYRFLNWSAYQAGFGTLGPFGLLGSRPPAEEAVGYADLLRDIYGDLYWEGPFDPSWRTEAAVGLARGMYARRDFAALPVLADALEDAGCADAGVIAHCRHPGPHVRGCWVVDLVLGKS